MINFKDWFLNEKKDEITPVHPEIKQWAKSIEKLKDSLEKLKVALKGKKIDVVVGKKNGKPEVEVKPVTKKEEPKDEKSKEEKPKEEKPEEEKPKVDKPKPDEKDHSFEEPEDKNNTLKNYIAKKKDTKKP